MTLGGCLMAGVIGFTSMARPAAAETDAALRSRLDAAEKKIADLESKQLSGQQGDAWLSTRRAEEIKGLVREVLADADTRASLLEGGPTAGHNGNNFYLSSDDGSFLLNMGGQIQFRHMSNFREGGQGQDSVDEHESGFEIPRAKLKFWGHIADPRLHYKITVEVDRDDNEAEFSEILIGYDLTDKLNISAGETKAPFLREELVDSGHQMAVERSLINEVFTMGTVQGMFVEYHIDKDTSNMFRLRNSINDGVRSGESERNNQADLHIEDTGTGENDKRYSDDSSDFAVTTRLDMRFMGDWSQADDFAAWSGEPTSFVVGVASHYEKAESGETDEEDSWFLTYTVDASFEYNGLSLYAMGVGLHVDEKADPSTSTTGANRDYWGVMLQGGYMVIPDKFEPFVRWEFIDMDNTVGIAADADEINLLTFGANYYLNKHNAKFTADVVWALSSLPTSGDMAGAFGMNEQQLSITGLLPDSGPGQRNQVLLRLQFQLLF